MTAARPLGGCGTAKSTPIRCRRQLDHHRRTPSCRRDAAPRLSASQRSASSRRAAISGDPAEPRERERDPRGAEVHRARGAAPASRAPESAASREERLDHACEWGPDASIGRLSRLAAPRRVCHRSSSLRERADRRISPLRFLVEAAPEDPLERRPAGDPLAPERERRPRDDVPCHGAPIALEARIHAPVIRS